MEEGSRAGGRKVVYSLDLITGGSDHFVSRFFVPPKKKKKKKDRVSMACPTARTRPAENKIYLFESRQALPKIASHIKRPAARTLVRPFRALINKITRRIPCDDERLFRHADRVRAVFRYLHGPAQGFGFNGRLSGFDTGGLFEWEDEVDKVETGVGF